MRRHFHCGSGGWTHEDGCTGCGWCMTTGVPAGDCTVPAYTDADRCPHHTSRDGCAECRAAALGHDFKRERGVLVPASWLESLAVEATEATAYTLASRLQNVGTGHATPGWMFTCTRCGNDDPHTTRECSPSVT